MFYIYGYKLNKDYLNRWGIEFCFPKDPIFKTFMSMPFTFINCNSSLPAAHFILFLIIGSTQGSCLGFCFLLQVLLIIFIS